MLFSMISFSAEKGTIPSQELCLLMKTSIYDRIVTDVGRLVTQRIYPVVEVQCSQFIHSFS